MGRGLRKACAIRQGSNTQCNYITYQPYKICKIYLKERQTCNRNQTCQRSVIATWRLGLQAPFVARNKYGPQNRNFLTYESCRLILIHNKTKVVALSEQTKSCSAGIRMLFANYNI